jgi:hypothetical protein
VQAEMHHLHFVALVSQVFESFLMVHGFRKEACILRRIDSNTLTPCPRQAPQNQTGIIVERAGRNHPHSSFQIKAIRGVRKSDYAFHDAGKDAVSKLGMSRAFSPCIPVAFNS